MYLYFDDKNRLLGAYPSTRGRPAKNHTPAKCHKFEFNYAIVDAKAASKFATVKELREAVANGDLANTAHFRPTHNLMPEAFADAITEPLQKAAITVGTPPEDQRQCAAIAPALRNGLHAIAANVGRGQEDCRAHLCDILHANKRLINRLIATPAGNGWFNDSTSGVFTAAHAAPTDTETEVLTFHAASSDTTVESIKMTTATADFGFGKMSTSPPELKVRTEETETDIATNNGVFLPRPDDTYIVNAQSAQLFKILEISSRNAPQNVKLVGPHGCGKTELAIQFAARHKRPLLIMDCANLREARDWFGYKSARDGTVYWHESQFVRAVSAGNHVILLDELNRANPHLLNTLMPLLDARRFTYLEEKGDKICVGPGTVFFASMNEGAGYTGTSSLDRAIRDRFPRVVELTYLGEEDEIALLVRRVGIEHEIAVRLVQMARKIRADATGLSASLTDSLSTRQLLAAAADFKIGGVETLTFTILNHFSPDGDESERLLVQNIVQGKFGDMLAAAAEKAEEAEKESA